MEMVGFSEEVVAQFTKVAATSLSSGTIGQIFVGLMVKSPQPGDPSYDLFRRECDAIYEGLCRRARRATKALNEIPGISSAEIEGAMCKRAAAPRNPPLLVCTTGMVVLTAWSVRVLCVLCVLRAPSTDAFPSIRLPDAYVAHAKSTNCAADELWCLELLEATGIVCVPGSGFKQVEGTWHFRMTILPQDAAFDAMLQKLASFMEALHAKWGVGNTSADGASTFVV
jgi:alanine transaminase